MIREKVKEKLREKKLKKIESLIIKKSDKKYKMFQYKKLFSEELDDLSLDIKKQQIKAKYNK